ncbi:MAG: hypothetical protein DRI95_14975 [Bacteroidetes bacterium]|nr:MAG: hypothetical protein DRI95_14975 [Bacteroidota bacterium]
MKEEQKIKRQKLIELSNVAKLAIEMGQTQADTVNGALIEMYTDNENFEFNTFKGWKQAGKMVKKGEHSKYFVWSKKRTNTKEIETEEGETEEKKYKFFGIAYLFSNTQVQEFKPKK